MSNNLFDESVCFNEGELVLNKDNTVLVKDRTLQVTTKGQDGKVVFGQECLELLDAPSM